MVECFRMTLARLGDARVLLNRFLRTDEHYLASRAAYGDSGPAALERALALLLERPELGFVWLAYRDGVAVAVCVVTFAVSTSAGAVVAKMDDVYVDDRHQGQGIGSAHLAALRDELRTLNIPRIDTSVHVHNPGARRFYEKAGFRPLDEKRLSCLI